MNLDLRQKHPDTILDLSQASTNPSRPLSDIVECFFQPRIQYGVIISASQSYFTVPDGATELTKKNERFRYMCPIVSKMVQQKHEHF